MVTEGLPPTSPTASHPAPQETSVERTAAPQKHLLLPWGSP